MPYEEMEEETGETPTRHPWPYLKPIFVTKTDSFRFKCLLYLLQKLIFKPEKVLNVTNVNFKRNRMCL